MLFDSTLVNRVGERFRAYYSWLGSSPVDTDFVVALAGHPNFIPRYNFESLDESVFYNLSPENYTRVAESVVIASRYSVPLAINGLSCHIPYMAEVVRRCSFSGVLGVQDLGEKGNTKTQFELINGTKTRGRVRVCLVTNLYHAPRVEGTARKNIDLSKFEAVEVRCPPLLRGVDDDFSVRGKVWGEAERIANYILKGDVDDIY